MPGVPCGYRSNYLTIAGLILLTTRAARCEACTAEHWDRGWQSRLGSGCAWHFSVCLALCSYRPCIRTDLSAQSYQMSANKTHKPGKRKTMNCATSDVIQMQLWFKENKYTHTRVRAS